MAASQGQTLMRGNPLIKSSFIFNSSAKRNSTKSKFYNFISVVANPRSAKSNLVKQVEIGLQYAWSSFYQPALEQPEETTPKQPPKHSQAVVN